MIDERIFRVMTPKSYRAELFGCEGCVHRKMTGCAQGRGEYPYGGPNRCFPQKKRDGYRGSVERATVKPESKNRAHTV